MIAIAVIASIVIAGGAFFAGMQYQKGQRGNFGQFGANGQRGMGMRTGNMNNFRPVTGEIISADDKTITVKIPDGSSKIVLFSDSTMISEATSSTKQSLQTGKKVMIFGSSNSDGSVTAQNIQLK